MKKFSTWLILSLGVVFLITRIVVAYTYSLGIDFMIKPMDINMEIIMIFVTLLSFVLIAKRKIIGSIIYLIGYCGYFGVTLVKNIINMFTKGTLIDEPLNVLFCLFAVALSIFSFLDLLYDKIREKNASDKNTDWFYKNKKYDKEKDSREDTNNYRTL